MKKLIRLNRQKLIVLALVLLCAGKVLDVYQDATKEIEMQTETVQSREIVLTEDLPAYAREAYIEVNGNVP